MGEIQPQLLVTASTFNLAYSDLLRGPNHIRSMFESADFDGMMVSDVRGIGVVGLARSLASSGPDELPATSFHQSWRGMRPRDLPGIYKEQGVKSAVGEAVLMAGLPNIRGSLSALGKIAGKRPIVVHPNSQFLGEKPPPWSVDYQEYSLENPDSNLLVQPTAEWMQREGFSLVNGRMAAQDLQAELPEMGFSGLAFDIQWALETRNEQRIIKPAEFLAEAIKLGLVQQIQLNYQPNLSDNPGRVIANLRRAISGNLPGTPQGELLSVANTVTPQTQATKLEVPVEIKASTVKDTAGSSDYMRPLGDIVSGVRTALSNFR
jgi:hypothetical protein